MAAVSGMFIAVIGMIVVIVASSFALNSVFGDGKIATLMLSAPRLAFVLPFFFLIVQ